jgi:uncharacterized protein
MELTHRFTVPVPIDEAWAHFNDIGSVAECFPGASVTSAEGDSFAGSVKVKLGPIALVYNGTGTFTEKDEAAHRMVVDAKGKDKRGNGTAGANVTLTMVDAGGSTDVEVVTDLAITGKPAQFGRGVIQDVSDKLLQQFVTCLQSKVGSPDAGTEPVAVPAGNGDREEQVATAPAVTQFEPSGTSTSEAADDSGAAGSSGGAVGARKAPATTYSGVSAGGSPGDSSGASGGDDNALDLGATVLPVIAKAYWRQIAGGVVALLVLYLLRRRRR